MYKFLFALCAVMFLFLCGCDKPSKGYKRMTHANILRINLGDDIEILDPRIARDQNSKCVLNMLYDGLMRLDGDSNPQPSVAKDVTVSEDGLIYTFSLRESYWSNGDSVVAEDFAKAWKKILEPGFPDNCASELFIIKNAQAVKKGNLSADNLGVDVIDDHTLKVTLASPIPYFLELISSSAFFPVCRGIDAENLEWGIHIDDKYISNGPFRLGKWEREEYIEVVRNPTYWDSDSVNLKKIVIMMVDGDTESEMFANDELDWVGNGFTSMPLQNFYEMAQDDRIDTPASMAMYWVRFNEGKKPFNNKKMLQAFGKAVDRKLVVDETTAAVQNDDIEENVDIIVARKFFDEANEKDVSDITLIYKSGFRNRKIAEVMQNKWKESLGVDVEIEEVSPLAYDERIQRGDFSVAVGFWPVEITNNGESYMNQPLLVDDMSIVPIYYYTVSHASKGRVHNIAESNEGSPDFKWTSVE